MLFRSLLILSLLFGLLACGRYEQVRFNLGAQRTLSPITLQDADLSGLQSICNALAVKNQGLSQMLNTQLTFEVRSKGCAEESLGESQDVGVSIQRSGDDFVFKQVSNGLDFVYPHIETITSGVLGSICQNLAAKTSPLQLPDGTALWFSTLSVDSAFCKPSGLERCLKLERGVQQGESFIVSSLEWIKFRLNPNESGYGFFSERRSVTRGICGPTQYIETQVLLK